MANFTGRLLRAARLDASLYKEVETDKDALEQAIGVVVLSSVAVGIGSITQVGLIGLVLGSVTALIAWCIWACLTYVIGALILPERGTDTNIGQVLLVAGFASSPGLIHALGVIPGLTRWIFLGASIWMLAAMTIAVRRVLAYKDTRKAAGVCAIGWLLYTLILAFLLN